MATKKYKCLLNGGAYVQNSGELIEGREYFVRRYFSGDDFTNIGGDNATNTTFTATGTTPANWSNFTEIMDVLNSAPVPTVHIDDFANPIEWRYHGEGQYVGYLENAFPRDKTYLNPFGISYLCAGLIDGGENDKEAYMLGWLSDSEIIVQTFRDEQLKDEIIGFATIEITVHD